jgi:glycosyltransferase involved in cell wall biosynthesis
MTRLPRRRPADIRPAGARSGTENDVRIELNRLRLENQRLHAELEDLSRPAALLARAVRRAYAAVRARVRGRQGAGALQPAGEAGFHPDYRPYVVRVPSPVAGHRPRVLHVIGNFHVGGSSRLVVDLVERLGDRYVHDIVSRDVPARAAYTGLTVHHWPELSSVGQAVAMLDALRPDLIHVHFLGHHGNRYSARDWSWYRRVFQAAERRRCPVVENVNIPVAPYVSDAVRRYVYVSDSVRGCFGMRSDDAVIYPGSDLARFARDGAPLPDDTAGMVYRLESDKLNPEAIEVFVELVRSRPAARVLIVGGGSLLPTYRQAVQDAGVAGAFTFPGYVSYDALADYYRRLSVFVAPVHCESFGQVSAFAMGMGIPVVGYAVGAIGELVGDPDLLAPPGDAPGLAKIIAELLDDRERRERIGAANRVRAEERFSVEAMATAFDALYREYLAK